MNFPKEVIEAESRAREHFLSAELEYRKSLWHPLHKEYCVAYTKHLMGQGSLHTAPKIKARTARTIRNTIFDLFRGSGLVNIGAPMV